MMSTLMADVQGPRLDILQKPVSFFVKRAVEGYKQLNANEGHSIVVHAWRHNLKMAVAYNPVTNTWGEISADVLEEDDPQPTISSELCTAISKNVPFFNFGGYNLQWEVGQKIRICRWQGNSRDSGVGFNMATGNIGSFKEVKGVFQVVKQEDLPE